MLASKARPWPGSSQSKVRKMSDRLPFADEVGEIMQQVLVEANFPTANFEALDHGFRSFLHPAFMPAWDRVRSLTATGGDALSMASGAYAAVLLAGFGFPVAPFDPGALRILATPSKDIDTVLALFSRNKTALVGYSVCDAPFYVLLTDCIRTLRPRVPSCPELADIKQLRAKRRIPATGPRPELHPGNGTIQAPTWR
jgi:hypothetical protein